MFCLHVYFRFNYSKLQDIKTDIGHRDPTEPNGDMQSSDRRCGFDFVFHMSGEV